MSSNLDVIGDALRDLGVISETQTPSAEQAAHTLRMMNQLAAELEGQGISLQWFVQTGTGDDFPLATEFESGFGALLAARIAPNYGATISPELAVKIQQGEAHLTRVAVAAALKPAEMVDRPCGPADGYSFNILTGG